jgi:hypothetical protein
MKPRTPTFGLMAEFEKPEELLEATRQARLAGYHAMDAYTPYPVKGVAAELGMRRNRVPFVILIAGIVGAIVGYSMQHWTMGVDYPLDVGGRPLNSWPVFLPIAFEVMVLVAAFAALFGMVFLNGLPQPYHPVFNAPRFALATRDRFFLCIEAADPKFDLEATRGFLESFDPREVTDVEE